MDERTFLILGANGQLGKALVARFPKARVAGRADLDIGDAAGVAGFDWSGVKVILNAAAYTKVDEAETTEGRRVAWRINAGGAANLAGVAVEHDLVLVHVSSDYVFDGSKPSHAEDEAMAPLGVYGQSKAAGDVAVSVTPKHYILRASWVIGDGPNFVQTMMNLAAKNVSPKVVDDQIGRLTFTATLVEAIEKLVKDAAPFGTYNVSNEGEPVSWARVTRAIFGAMGREDLTVTGVSTAEYFKDKPEAAPRPLQSTLDLTKIEAAGLQLTDWREALQAYVAFEQRKEG